MKLQAYEFNLISNTYLVQFLHSDHVYVGCCRNILVLIKGLESSKSFIFKPAGIKLSQIVLTMIFTHTLSWLLLASRKIMVQKLLKKPPYFCIFKNKVSFKTNKITLLLTDNSWVLVTSNVTENLVSKLKNPTQPDYFFCQYLACIEA